MEEVKINGYCPIFKEPDNLEDFKEEDLQTINSIDGLKDGMKILVPDHGGYSVMDVEDNGGIFYGRTNKSSALLKFIEGCWVCTGIMNFGMLSAGKRMIIIDDC